MSTRPRRLVDASLASRFLRLAGPVGLPRSLDRELLDSENWTDAELREAFLDIERVNRYLGGTKLTIDGVSWLLAGAPDDDPTAVLDLGSGSADIPIALLKWAKTTGRTMTVVASDASERILRLNARADMPGLTREVADCRSLSFADGSFDVVTCSMLVHHLPDADASATIKEMLRVCRIGIVVNDLIRNRVSFYASKALFAFGTSNRVTRNDGPLSMRKAFSVGELLDLVTPVAPGAVRIRQYALYRVAISARVT